MAVSKFEVNSRSDFAGGQSWGEFGNYEQIDGLVTFKVDPKNSTNRSVIDIDHATTDENGLVTFTSDVVILKPAHVRPSRLLVDVVNRGRKRAVADFNMASPNLEPSSSIDPGNGFLFDRGYAVASIGWQFDVFRSDALMGMDPPYLLRNRKMVTGTNVVEIRPNNHMTSSLLANRIHRPYPAASTDNSNARLFVREWEDGPDTKIPNSEWCFAKEADGELTADDEYIYMASGFQAGKIYNVIYEAKNPVLTGASLLSVRDIGSWLKYGGKDSPISSEVDFAYAYGISQTGRLLRSYLYFGMNLDESERQVYDGLLPHVAGGRRGDFNHRFGQPSQQSGPGFGHLFPFTDDPYEDAFQSVKSGLLDHQVRKGGMPKIIYTNTSAEYWRGDASLAHTHPTGCCDVDFPNNVRSYLFSSTQHIPRSLPLDNSPGPDGSMGRNPFNIVDFRPLLRAALVNLEKWSEDGIEPPPNKHPRLDNGTAVTRQIALNSLPKIPNVFPPDPDRLWRIRELDLGPEAEAGIAHYPVIEGREYPAFVSSLDKDGNEVSGICMPDISVPVGTHTGWNTRDPKTGAPEQIIPMMGFTEFFSTTESIREAVGDPRESIEKRYRSREEYLHKVNLAATELIEQRYLLKEDLTTVTRNCCEIYNEAISRSRL